MEKDMQIYNFVSTNSAYKYEDHPDDFWVQFIEDDLQDSTKYYIRYVQPAHIDRVIAELDKLFSESPLVEVDTETNVTDDETLRTLHLIQFGFNEGKDVYVIDYQYIDESLKSKIVEWLQMPLKKIAQNVSFEYKIFKRHVGVRIDNLLDPMLINKTLRAGNQPPSHIVQQPNSLAHLLKKYLGILLDKSLQTSFEDPSYYTPEQIRYAGDDVCHLWKLVKKQMADINTKYHYGEIPELLPVLKLEHKFVRVKAEMEYWGYRFNNLLWEDNISWVRPVHDTASAELDTFLKSDEVRKRVTDALSKRCDPKKRKFYEELYVDEDQYVFNPRSTTHKELVYRAIGIPEEKECIKQTKLGPKEYTATDWKKETILHWLNKNHVGLSEEVKLFMFEHMNGAPDEVQKDLLNDIISREKLVELGLIIPKGTVNMLWTSHAKVLYIFNLYHPKLQGTGKDAIEDCHSEVVDLFKQWNLTYKLTTSYAEAFYNFVDSDGRVRTTFDQIKSTGRLSSSKPNLQQLPKGKHFGTRYRKPFMAREGCALSISDYSGMELLLGATLANETGWLEAIRDGKDLHTLNAYKANPATFIAQAEDDCAFLAKDEQGNMKMEKCSCKNHKVPRSNAKTLGFGIMYGASAIGLAPKVHQTKENTQILIDGFFTGAPAIAAKIEETHKDLEINGYSLTLPPFERPRFYSESDRRKNLNACKRQSFNARIQGSGADIGKLAAVFMMIRLEQDYATNGKFKDVIVVGMIHDELHCDGPLDVIHEWARYQQGYMELAAAIVCGHTIQKTDPVVCLDLSEDKDRCIDFPDHLTDPIVDESVLEIYDPRVIQT